MNDFFWYMFERSGNINFYLAYKNSKQGADTNEFGQDKGNNNS